MSRHHLLAWAAAALIAPAALVSVLATPLAAGAPAAAAKAKHHKAKHHKKHHKAKPKHKAAKQHKTAPTKTAKLEECRTTVSGSGPEPETNTYGYQVILTCGRGEFSSFSISTNRTIVEGSITAQLGTEYKYSCEQTSGTSFSCSGVNVAIPPYEEGALRAFFRSTQPMCEGSSPETATVTTEGETFEAKLGEVQSAC